MRKFIATSNLNTIELNGKHYVSTSNKKKFWRSTESDTKEQAELEALQQMFRDSEYRTNQIRNALLDAGMNWDEIDGLL